MFRDTLLESANFNRKRNRWPMVLAFTAEIIVGAFLVMLPLLSTGVISVSAHTPLVSPLGHADVHRTVTHATAGGKSILRPTVIVPLMAKCIGRCVIDPHLGTASDEPTVDGKFDIVGSRDGVPNLPFGQATPPQLEPVRPKRPVMISHLAEGQLITRVDPIYPRLAGLAQIQGIVQLHAIIGKDGSIQSLSVVNGAPMLAAAAIDAVRQWRYKPYLLNGEAVDVETFITVNFKKTND
jgi:protein TonB